MFLLNFIYLFLCTFSIIRLTYHCYKDALLFEYFHPRPLVSSVVMKSHGKHMTGKRWLVFDFQAVVWSISEMHTIFSRTHARTVPGYTHTHAHAHLENCYSGWSFQKGVLSPLSSSEKPLGILRNQVKAQWRGLTYPISRVWGCFGVFFQVKRILPIWFKWRGWGERICGSEG